MRRIRALALVFMVALIWPGLAYGQAGCDSAKTQADMNECSGRSAANADRRLALLVHDVRAGLDSSLRAGFDRAQSAWVRYRRLECSWEGDGYAGGSMQPLVINGCWAQLTEQRIVQLKPQICEGGAPDCEETRKYDPPTPVRSP